MSRNIPTGRQYLASSVDNQNNYQDLSWIHASVDLIFSSSEYVIGKGEEPYFAEVISIGIDTSSSTDNHSSRGRGGGSGRSGFSLTENSFVSDSGTDPIIAAEIKGVIYYLLDTSQRYNLKGVILQVSTFSDTLKREFECVIDDHAVLDQTLRKLSRRLTYSFQSTNLMSFFQAVCLDSLFETKKVHMVLATDGQPNTGGSSQDIIKFIQQKIPEKMYRNFSMAIIGAGSIQASQGGGRGILGQGGRDSIGNSLFRLSENDKYINYSGLLTILSGGQPQSSSNSECNLNFLLEIMDLIKSSVYLPAFGNYQKLRETTVLYFDNIANYAQICKYKVVLDGGKMVELPDQVQKGLGQLTSVVFFIQLNQTWYLYTRKWQVSVHIDHPEQLDKSKYYIPTTDFDMLGDFYQVRMKSAPIMFNLTEQSCQVSVKIDPTNGFWCCRQIVRV